MGLSAIVDALAKFELTGSPAIGGPASHKFDGWPVQQFDNGVLAGQADRIYATTITLAASGNQDIDLNGALLDSLGGPAVFAKVKAICIRARAANINNVIVGNAAANGFIGPFGLITHTIAIQPGGLFVITAPGLAGWTVTAATADLLRVTNSGAGTTVTLDIVILGTSA